LSREAFWTLTLRELFRELVVAKRRRRDVYEAATAATLLGEQLHRMAQLPTLAQLVAGPATPSTSDEEQRARWHQAAASAGLTVRRHNPKRYRIVRSYPRAS